LECSLNRFCFSSFDDGLGDPSGNSRTGARRTLYVFTDSTLCFNKSTTGLSAAPHTNTRKHSWFIVDDDAVTQMCSNASPAEAHSRASRTPCKDWPGNTVKVESLGAPDLVAGVRAVIKGMLDIK
jgi:hypothetical protein